MSQSKFTVWGQPRCIYCDLVKTLLKQKGLSFEYLEVGNNVSTTDFMTKVPGTRSVPQVFVDDIHIGGYKELVEYLSSVKI